MTERVDLYSSYAQFDERVLDEVRKETFATDIGQNSWVTVDEYERFVPWLELSTGRHALEVASGSGGPALHLARITRCRVTGIDADAGGVGTASRRAGEAGADASVEFRVADANQRLPFDDDAFDAVVCIDSMNHFPDRSAVLGEWRRVLRPGGRAWFTDPVVVTGPVTHEEIAERSSVGTFLFVPPGVNEALIEKAGLRLILQEDVTGNIALVSERWHRARQARRAELVRIEGEERFGGLQRFFDAVCRLSSERRLSRIAYIVEKPGD
jgi:SAM-dependent methyltransferase